MPTSLERLQALSQPATGQPAAPSNSLARLQALTRQPQSSAPGMTEGLARSAAQGATFNFADEIEAGARALLDAAQGDATFGERYGHHVENIRRGIERFREEHPGKALAAEVAGAVAVPGLGAAKAAQTAATAGGRVARGLAAGSGAGGLAGAGAAEGDLAERGAGAVRGAVAGGSIGAAVPAAGAGAAKLGRVAGFWKKAAGPKAPTVDQLKAEASELYARARNAGVQIRPDPWAGFVDDIEQYVRKKGIDPDLHSRANAALNRLVETRGKSLTLDETETLRRVLQSAGESNSDSERRLFGKMLDRFDDWRGALKQDDVLSGDPQAASLLPQARSLWHRVKKGEILEKIIKDAEDLRANQYSQSGVENALRTEFRKLASNTKKMCTFNAAEEKAIRDVAKGAPVANAVRRLGKFSPRGPVSGGFALGSAALGGIPGLAVPLIGEASAHVAARMTRERALAAQELALRGAQAPPAPLSPLGGGPLARGITMGATIPFADRMAEERR
jgi:hypothetical protein